MSKGVNKVILIGNLGADPEVRYMPSGSSVANISLATNDSWKDKQTGELQERTEWHKVCLFDKLAQIAGEYLKKGSKIYIEGSIRTRKWQDQTGNDRYTTEIVANTMQMLDSKEMKSKGGEYFSDNNTGFTSNVKNNNQNSPEMALDVAIEETDDIPF